MSEYDLQPVGVDDDSISQVSSLLRQVFPEADHLTDEVLQWQYRDNPAGTAVGFNAWDGAQLVGHYVTIPLVATIHGVQERGLLSLNTATHPDHQGKGLFTTLARATYAAGVSQGFGFVVGVANANSTHGFVKKLDFQLVSPLRAMVGIGPLVIGSDVATLDYSPIWTPDALRWRMAHPERRYHLVRQGRSTLLMSAESRFGASYSLGVVPDGVAASTMAPQRPPLMKLWMGLDPAIRWRRSAFANIPMRVRPAPLNLIFRDLTDEQRTLDPQLVRFQAMDFDVV